MNYQAVIFDRDGTLTTCDTVSDDTLMPRCEAIAPTLPKGIITTHWVGWKGPWPRAKEEEPHFWWSFWSALAPRYGLSDTTVRRLQAESLLYHRDFRPVPYAIETVRKLYDKGLQLALLTNFELPSADLTLQSAGIDPKQFTAILSSGMLGIYKPDPRVYLAAADAIGIPPSDCVFVDDLIENVQGACNIGMRGILLDRNGEGAPLPFECVSNLCDLIDLLAEYQICVDR